MSLITRLPPSASAVALVLAGCATADAPLAGYPGTRSQVTSYYDSRAMEMNAACTQPRIDTITEARVVGETAEQVRMDVRYHWTDDSRQRELGNGGSVLLCGDFASRTFTFARNGDALTLVGMTGEQKQL
jgi:hypothetical protein